MVVKDILTLSISSLALVLSIYNFYVQRVRREDKLIGNLISIKRLMVIGVHWLSIQYVILVILN